MKEYIVSDDSYEYEMRRYDELKELIRCRDCKNWCKGDGLFPTIDGVQFHACMELIVAGTKDSEALVPEFHYCSWAERRTE